jgi:hypothetical protein
MGALVLAIARYFDDQTNGAAKRALSSIAPGVH